MARTAKRTKRVVVDAICSVGGVFSEGVVFLARRMVFVVERRRRRRREKHLRRASFIDMVSSWLKWNWGESPASHTYLRIEPILVL